jgi:hypothetical protein
MDRRKVKIQQAGPDGAASGVATSGPQSGSVQSSAGTRQPRYCGDIGLRIRADGVWLYRDSPIARHDLVKLFAGVLQKEASGRSYLVTPAEKVDVTVDDAAFIAIGMQAHGAGRTQQLIFETNVGDVVLCGPANPLRFSHASQGGGLKPYLLVRGRLEALVARALVYDLVDLAVTAHVDGGEVLGVWSGGAFFTLQPDTRQPDTP